MEAEARAYSASTAFALLQVGPGGPHRGIIGHVVVSSEQLHFLPAKQEPFVHLGRATGRGAVQ